nr:hypothetical protein [Pandoravirus massiliensis]
MDEPTHGPAGLLGTLNDNDCLMHILRCLPLRDYMTLALANKHLAAFLVDDAVLRATWGARLGVSGRFDSRFGPHQCIPAQDDPGVPFAVPRAWRHAAHVSVRCVMAAKIVVAVYGLNVARDDSARSAETFDASMLDTDDCEIATDGVIRARQEQDQTRRARSWLFIWRTRWLAAVEARALRALYVLALALNYSVRIQRVADLMPLEPSLAHDVDKTIGPDFYGARDAHSNVPPSVDATPEKMAERSMLRYAMTSEMTGAIHNALGCLAPCALTCVVDPRVGIARLLVSAADMWNYGLHQSARSDTVAATRHNLIVYSTLRARKSRAKDAVDVRKSIDAISYDMVPRDLRRDAQMLMIACAGVDRVLAGHRGVIDSSLVRKHKPPGYGLATRMAAAIHHEEALQMLVESVPFAQTLVDNRSVLVAPLHQMSSPCGASASAGPSKVVGTPTEGAALVTWIRLWSLVMADDIETALANVSLLYTTRTDTGQYAAAAFDAAVLLDMINAWRGSDTAWLRADAHIRAIMGSARLTILLSATIGGAMGMKNLRASVGHGDVFAWLVSADSCRDLAMTVADQTSSIVNRVGAIRAPVLVSYARPLHCYAYASIPYGLDDQAREKVYPYRVDNAEAIDSLHMIVDKLKAMDDALAWCLKVDDLLDRETARHVNALANYIKTTRDYAGSILDAITETTTQ